MAKKRPRGWGDEDEAHGVAASCVSMPVEPEVLVSKFFHEATPLQSFGIEEIRKSLMSGYNRTNITGRGRK